MTAPRTFTSPAGRADRRAEFIDFYKSTYPAVTGELLALTGDLDVAHAVAGASYARAWQAWPAVRSLDQPAMWVRTDAVRRTRRPPRGDGILQHGLPALPEVALDPEDEVLVAGLQRLPVVDRLPLVLHYVGHIPVETIAAWFGEQDDEVEAQLDSGFDALVGILDWPADEGASAGRGDAYDWTAEALEDCGRRFAETIPVPPPTLVFRRGTVTKVTRRGAPITAAAAAAVVGLVAYLSPAPGRTAQAAMYAAPPPVMAESAPAEPGTAIPETTASATRSPAGTVTRSVARRVTTTKPTAGSAVAAVPAVAVSSSPVVTTSATPTSTTPTSMTPTSTTPTSTTPTSTTPTTTTAATGGGTGSDNLAASDSTGTESTGSSVVTTTDSTTPDTSTDETTSDETSTDETTTDETTTDETSTATTTRHRNRDWDDYPPTTSTIQTSTTQTSTTQTSTTATETGTTDAGTTLSTTATASSSE